MSPALPFELAHVSRITCDHETLTDHELDIKQPLV